MAVEDIISAIKSGKLVYCWAEFGEYCYVYYFVSYEADYLYFERLRTLFNPVTQSITGIATDRVEIEAQSGDVDYYTATHNF